MSGIYNSLFGNTSSSEEPSVSVTQDVENVQTAADKETNLKRKSDELSFISDNNPPAKLQHVVASSPVEPVNSAGIDIVLTAEQTIVKAMESTMSSRTLLPKLGITHLMVVQD